MAALTSAGHVCGRYIATCAHGLRRDFFSYACGQALPVLGAQTVPVTGKKRGAASRENKAWTVKRDGSLTLTLQSAKGSDFDDSGDLDETPIDHVRTARLARLAQRPPPCRRRQDKHRHQRATTCLSSSSQARTTTTSASGRLGAVSAPGPSHAQTRQV